MFVCLFVCSLPCITEFAFANPDHHFPPYSPDDRATTLLTFLAEVRDKPPLFLLPHCLSLSQIRRPLYEIIVVCLMVQNMLAYKRLPTETELAAEKLYVDIINTMEICLKCNQVTLTQM